MYGGISNGSGVGVIITDGGPQTKIRIRGKNNQYIETKGSLIRTMDQERVLEEKKR